MRLVPAAAGQLEAVDLDGFGRTVARSQELAEDLLAEPGAGDGLARPYCPRARRMGGLGVRCRIRRKRVGPGRKSRARTPSSINGRMRIVRRALLQPPARGSS